VFYDASRTVVRCVDSGDSGDSGDSDNAGKNDKPGASEQSRNTDADKKNKKDEKPDEDKKPDETKRPPKPDGEVCEGGQAFNECGSACTSTCDDPAPMCTLQCVPRCQCPADHPIWYRGRCIPAKFCPDLEPVVCKLGNREYEPGDAMPPPATMSECGVCKCGGEGHIKCDLSDCKDCKSDINCDEGFCKTETGACGEKGRCSVMHESCSDERKPVCGCDGVTYATPCKADSMGVSLKAHSACESLKCPSAATFEGSCDQAVTWAMNPLTRRCCRYRNPCVVPESMEGAYENEKACLQPDGDVSDGGGGPRPDREDEKEDEKRDPKEDDKKDRDEDPKKDGDKDRDEDRDEDRD